jgi:two-component system sensor kinase FixL
MSDVQQELRLGEALLQAMLDIVPDGLVVIDTKGIIQSFSPSAERMFGYTGADVIGRNVSMLMPEPQAKAHDGYIERYLTTGERRIIGIGRIVVGRRKDGLTFPMELQIGEVEVSGTHLFVGFTRDLTQREDRERRMAELQAEVIHLSRVSDLGHMASAIAHEVNQPLTAIGNYLGGIRRLLTPDTPPMLRQAIDKVGEQADRARDIVGSLRALVKKGTRPQHTENLETLIHEASALALIGTNQSVGLDLRVAADAAFASVDKVQIQQVLLNLMRNAIEAMDGSTKNRLTIETTRQSNRIEIAVSDTGPGLPDAVRDTLFQPFASTKTDGLGVGLSICSMIVEAHGGELTAETLPEGGARFRFTVPTPSQT